MSLCGNIFFPMHLGPAHCFHWRARRSWNRVRCVRKCPQRFRYLSCIDLDFTVMIFIWNQQAEIQYLPEFVQDQSKILSRLHPNRIPIIPSSIVSPLNQVRFPGVKKVFRNKQNTIFYTVRMILHGKYWQQRYGIIRLILGRLEIMPFWTRRVLDWRFYFDLLRIFHVRRRVLRTHPSRKQAMVGVNHWPLSLAE